MKSLIKNIFSKSKTEEASNTEVSNIQTEENIPINDAPTSSKPLRVSNEKLPLGLLKKLAPIRDLDDDEIMQLEQRVLTFSANSVVFALGQKSECIYYLLKGELELESDGGGSYVVSEGSALSNLPLNNGKVFGATAISRSPCLLLATPVSIMQWWKNKSQVTQDENDNTEVKVDLPKEMQNIPFAERFIQAYRKNELILPSLPQVAIQLRKAMEQDIGISEAIKIVEIDALVVARLIQLANSAMYASTTPIKNCHDAVSRLGLKTTQKLVMGICMKHLFQGKSPQLAMKMQNLWKKNLLVSSLSFVLAQESGEVNPEDALLAGLVCDIGAVPLIHFAEKNEDIRPDVGELEQMMPRLSAGIGPFLLQKLDFSDEFVNVPEHSENWYYESGEDRLTLIDIVILAKFHSYLGTVHMKNLPYINSIPAYGKLKNGKLNSDFSLDIVAKAKQRIDATMRIFA